MKRSLAYCAAFFAVLFLGLSALPPNAHALVPGDEKNLRGRLGLGFTNQIAISGDRTIPALSAKYYVNRTTAFGIGAGFDTRTGDSSAAVGAKFFKNVFLESNLLFYLGVGAAYISHSGSHLQGSVFLGAEFFFAQLPSLGFSFEAGIRGDNTTGSFAIRTTGDSFLSAGIHFYL